MTCLFNKYLKILIIMIFISLTFSACDQISTGNIIETTDEVTSTATPSTTTRQETPQSTPIQVTPETVNLRIWVPPIFDPEANTRGGNLLKARLNIFERRRPEVNLEVRVKAVDGPGGLIDSLTTTSAAASLAMPDLIALPEDLLEIAALKGFLQSLDQFSEIQDDTDWFAFSEAMSQIQGSIYAIPFASDFQVLIYRNNIIETPPTSWEMTYELNTPLVFSAADEKALFTLIQYQAAGGAIRDSEDRPSLDSEALKNVFSFYQQAELAEVMPYWLTQYQDDEQIWTAFEENRADMVVSWISRILNSEDGNISFAPIPTSSGEPFTYATGWSWAFPNQQETHLSLSLELAEFLTEKDFLTIWNQETGFVPPRPSAIRDWEEDEIKIITNQIASNARLIPSPDIITSLGEILQQATVQVLKQQTEPLNAAQNASASLSTP
jgi:multiple sugar transport system substrate-binding protein